MMDREKWNDMNMNKLEFFLRINQKQKYKPILKYLLQKNAKTVLEFLFYPQLFANIFQDFCKHSVISFNNVQ